MQNDKKLKAAVLGSGAWGTALACVLHRNGHKVTLWSAFEEEASNLAVTRRNPLLDGVVLRIGLSYLFGIVLDMGFFGFVLGYGLAPYGYAIPSLIYFLSGIWKKKKALAEAREQSSIDWNDYASGADIDDIEIDEIEESEEEDDE